MLNVTNQPFSAPPLAYTDTYGEHWIYVGTGRLYTQKDNLYEYQNSFYGLKEPKDSLGKLTGVELQYKQGNPVGTDIVDTTMIVTNGQLLGKRGQSIGDASHDLGLPENATMHDHVVSAVQQKQGWMYNYVYGLNESAQNPDGTANLKRRTLGRAEVLPFFGTLLYPTYDVTLEKCKPEGTGVLYAPSLTGGISALISPLGVGERRIDNTATEPGGDEELLFSQGFRGLGNLSGGLIQTSTGELFFPELVSLDVSGGRRSWREIPVNWNWK